MATNKRVHRIVALTFTPNPENKLEVNHIDGVKTNNCVNNLEWNTRSENVNHSFAQGLNTPRQGEKNGASKLTLGQAHRIRTLAEIGHKRNAIAAMFGVSISAIDFIVKRRSWKHI